MDRTALAAALMVMSPKRLTAAILQSLPAVISDCYNVYMEAEAGGEPTTFMQRKDWGG